MRLGALSFAGLVLAMVLVVGYVTASPLVGRWSDATGRRFGFALAGLVLTAVSLLGLAIAVDPMGIAAAMLVLALGTAPTAALVGDAAPPAQRGAMMAAYGTLGDLASSAGTVLGTAVALGVGFSAVYLGTAVLLCATVLAIARHSGPGAAA